MKQSTKKITKAIIAAGGFGSRLLPVTSALPKELLPFLDTPVIHHIVNQCIKAGITEIIIVGRTENKIIHNYFQPNEKLKTYLIKNGKKDRLKSIEDTYNNANITFALQDETLPYGNARPLYTVRNMIEEGESFIYTYGDDLIYGEDCGIEELVKTFDEHQSDVVLMCKEVPDDMVSKVGIVNLKPNSIEVDHIKEKPKLESTTSRLASVASYVFNSDIFKELDPSYSDSEIHEFFIQKGIENITQKGKTIACVTNGEYLTCGDPLNYLKSSLKVAMDRPELHDYLLEEFLPELIALKKTNEIVEAKALS